MLSASLAEAAERSASPTAVSAALERLVADGYGERLNGPLLDRLCAVVAASRSLTRLCLTDPDALDVLASLERRRPRPASNEAEVVRWQRLEMLRIAACDLSGRYGLEEVGAALAAMADDVFARTWEIAGPAGVAVIGMGKYGGRELNYASDVDVMFVGEGDVRQALALARKCFRVDADLRPEGRNGPLVRSLDAFRSYWERWAETWEFQALLKARPVAGDGTLGSAFA